MPQERLNFQKGLGRLAARDAAVFELLMDVRNLLKPLNVLDDPSIVSRIENEVALELSLSSAAQVASTSFKPLFLRETSRAGLKICG